MLQVSVILSGSRIKILIWLLRRQNRDMKCVSWDLARGTSNLRFLLYLAQRQVWVVWRHASKISINRKTRATSSARKDTLLIRSMLPISKIFLALTLPHNWLRSRSSVRSKRNLIEKEKTLTLNSIETSCMVVTCRNAKDRMLALEAPGLSPKFPLDLEAIRKDTGRKMRIEPHPRYRWRQEANFYTSQISKLPEFPYFLNLYFHVPYLLCDQLAN